MPRIHSLLPALVLAALAVPALAVPALAATPTADAAFAKARAQARQEHKDVLVVFSASWCGPCKLFERYLDDPAMQALTQKAFVIDRVDVGERPGDPHHADTPGGVQLRTALGAAGEPGFPFLVITDASGKPIVNSYRNGNTSDNIGYPVLPQEIDWYVEMLRRAAPSLSAADLDATRTWLQQHAPR